MSGAGNAWPAGRPPGTGGAEPVGWDALVWCVCVCSIQCLPPGLLGIAGAGRPPAGGGGGPRPAELPIDPWRWKEKQVSEDREKFSWRKVYLLNRSILAWSTRTWWRESWILTSRQPVIFDWRWKWSWECGHCDIAWELKNIVSNDSKVKTSTELTNDSQRFLASVIHSKHLFAFRGFLGALFHHLILQRETKSESQSSLLWIITNLIAARIQMSQQLSINEIFRVIHDQIHNGLWHHIAGGFRDNLHVRIDQIANGFNLSLQLWIQWAFSLSLLAAVLKCQQQGSV